VWQIAVLLISNRSGESKDAEQDGDVRIMAATSRKERVDLRISADQKRLIERAATLSGQTLSSFILGTTVERAREIVRESAVIDLSNRDRDRFLKALEDDSARPNAALRRPARRHKAMLG
jgi:uncharacterized protein (DUF1778 family)